MILYTLSTESTFVISIALPISRYTPPLRLRWIHRTVGPLPFCLLLLVDVNSAGDTLILFREGANEMKVCMIDDDGNDVPFSLLFLVVDDCETYTSHIDSISDTSYSVNDVDG